jgi:hypothetical protein
MANYAVFLSFYFVFMFWPCPNPADRMERWEPVFGFMYAKIDYTKFVNRVVPFCFIFKRGAFVSGCYYWKV